MSPQLDRPPPPYLQIVEHYRDRIRDGRLEDGERLPSTRQLAQEWRVAHATAAKVLSTLRTEGLVRAVSGGAGGTLVHSGVPDDPDDPINRGHGLHHLVRTATGEPRIVSADVEPRPPAHVAQALGLAAGAAAIRRRQVLAAGEVPQSASTGWFAADLGAAAPALLLDERVPGGTAAYVARCTGRVLGSGRDEIRIVPADPGTAATLAVDEGSSVLLTRSWVLDRDGGVVEFGECVSVPALPLAYEYALA
ncbi:GntR family transcriptional regulator [Kineosporia sp. A_224]|uniref:GntR family transcriptional regulator n=1 Tax=Kineosporia sp. A_224 TaxID=1962180 RepID=UPI000B4B8022|nr:GntR family transcriptional regulator [Kineosporia sp. A_224]